MSDERLDRIMRGGSSGPDEVIGEALPDPIIPALIVVIILPILFSVWLYYFEKAPWYFCIPPLAFPAMMVYFWWKHEGRNLWKERRE